MDVVDAVAILRHAAAITPLTADELRRADVTGSGTDPVEVEVEDAVRILPAILDISPGKDLIPNLICP